MILNYGKEKIAHDYFGAYLINKASPTYVEEYPIIAESMVAKEVPKHIEPFAKVWEKRNVRKDLSDIFICTYANDNTFERIRKNPKRYLNFFKKTAGIIGFDYSVHTDMPVIKQKSQMYDNLSLIYFYASHGVNVIPNIRCGVDELLPEFLSTIPKNSLIAICTHGFMKYKHELYEWYCFLEKIIEYLHPSGIIVYGSLSSSLFDEFKKIVPFYIYKPV